MLRKTSYIAIPFSEAVRLKFLLNVSWPETDFSTGCGSITLFLGSALHCTKGFQILLFPVWTERIWQLLGCSITQNNIISSFLRDYAGYEWRLDHIVTSDFCMPRCINHQRERTKKCFISIFHIYLVVWGFSLIWTSSSKHLMFVLGLWVPTCLLKLPNDKNRFELEALIQTELQLLIWFYLALLKECQW